MTRPTVRLEREGPVLRVVLDRPEVRNAFNDRMIAEIDSVFIGLRDDEDIRAVILAAEGDVFCAGADLNWMRRVLQYTYEENHQDSYKLAMTIHRIYECPKPVIARVQGPAIGGGAGLVAACDIAIASRNAVFGFSETKLGLIPATIAPYLRARMGEGPLRELFLTGERFDADRAAVLGLVNAVVEPEDLDATIEAKLRMILTGGPEALRECKRLLEDIADDPISMNVLQTSRWIAERRMSAEGQEGMAAFLEKRKPRWVEEP